MDTKALRQKILDLVIRGKLVPQDPSDEPASVLLERIRTQKLQMVQEGKLKAKDIRGDSIIFLGDDNLHYEKFADGTVKCIEDEIPFDVPEGWAWTRLGCIAETSLGRMLDASKNRGRLHPYLRNVNVRWDKFDLSDLYEMRFEDSETARYSISYGDLVICEGGEPGRCAVWQHDELIYFQKALHRVRTILTLSSYISCVIQCLTHSRVYERYYTGTTIKHLTGQALQSILIPLPPHREQQRIVDVILTTMDLIQKLEEDKCAIESLIAETKTQILDLAIRGKLVPQDPTDEPASVLLERIRAERETLIRSGKIKRDKRESVIFRGDDNSYYEKVGSITTCINDEIPYGIPKSWEWVRGYLCFRGMESKKPIGECFRYIDIDSIDNTRHVVTAPKEMLVSEAPSRANRALHNGSVVFSLVRPYLENIAFIDEPLQDCIASTGFFVCDSSGLLYPQYMYYLMTSGYVVSGLNSYMKGDNSPSISVDNIMYWLYPIPPYTEQVRICEVIERLQTITTAIEESIT